MVTSVLTDPGWIAFIEHKHGLEHRILTAGTKGSDTAYAEILVFLNSRGKLRTPKLTSFMPISIQHTQTTSPTKIQRQWIELAGELAEKMDDLGYGGSVSLDPLVTDVRPWQWRGIAAEVRYTYLISPSDSLENLSNSKRKALRKTRNMGYSAGLTDDLDAVLHCLKQSEDRQQFETGLSAEDLRYLSSHVTPGVFRAYLVHDSSGQPVSARVALGKPGGDSIGLVAGTDSHHLRNGAAQISIGATLEDLRSIGVKTFDFGGANIESVAHSKMQWGGTLTPYYTLSALGPRFIALQGKRWVNRKIREVRG